MTDRLWKIYAYFYDVLFELLPYQQLINATFDALPSKLGVTTLLDAGCGTANFEQAILTKGKSHLFAIEAIDSSAAMLSKAKRKLQECAWFQFKLIDLNGSLPFADNFFDGIVCINSIYATRNPTEVLLEFHRKLKPGGTLLLVNPIKNPTLSAVLAEHISLGMQRKGLDRCSLFFRNMLKLPQFFLVMVTNLLILKLSKNAVFHFFDMNEFKALINGCGFKINQSQFVYGATDIFIVAEKQSVVAQILPDGK